MHHNRTTYIYLTFIAIAIGIVTASDHWRYHT